MKVTIQSPGFKLTESLEKYTREKLALSLGRYRQKITEINVTLLDINGPKGGEDMRCKILIKVIGMHPILLQETSDDMYLAISSCLQRSRQTLIRQIRKADRKKISQTDFIIRQADALST